MARDEDPLQGRRRDAVQHLEDRLSAAFVAEICLSARLGYTEQFDAEGLGDPLPSPGLEVGGDAQDSCGPTEAPELGGPPPVGWLQEDASTIARRLACPGVSLRTVRGRLEQGVVGAVDPSAVGADGCDGHGTVGHVSSGVQREGDLMDKASHHGEREARPCLSFSPMVQDDPAADAGLGVEASVGHDRYPRITVGPIGGGDERPVCRGTRLGVRLQSR